ncbi:hypothetical protein Droror1_Dr00027224, partial [Drosera rotundifolia]
MPIRAESVNLRAKKRQLRSNRVELPENCSGVEIGCFHNLSREKPVAKKATPKNATPRKAVATKKVATGKSNLSRDWVLSWSKKAYQSADERRREEEEKRRFDSAKAECAAIEKAQVEAREHAERDAVLRVQEDEDEENDEVKDGDDE